MNRLKSWTWFDSGYPSITVPFHDTNDFYYSGHVGTCILWMVEFWGNNYKVMVVFSILNLIFQWWFLSVTNAHYIIDLVTGMLISHLFTIMGEVSCYLMDVVVVGWAGKQRNLIHHNPCKKCGWSNAKLEQMCSKTEINFLKKTYKHIRSI